MTGRFEGKRALITGGATGIGLATAEQLVAGKAKADMTYLQLMEMMGAASALIHEGLIRENKQMIEQGANYILNHPAPKHKPWTIMPEADQADFKQSLLAFDSILDTHARNILQAAQQDKWQEASNAAFDLTSSCISCHAMWKQKTM